MASQNKLTGHTIPGMAAPEPLVYREYPRWEERNGKRVLVEEEERIQETVDSRQEGEGQEDEFADLTKAQICEKYGLDLDPNRNSKAEIVEAAKAAGNRNEEIGNRNEEDLEPNSSILEPGAERP